VFVKNEVKGLLMTKLPMVTISQSALVYPSAGAEMLRTVEAAVRYDTSKTLRLFS
jgi:hypothetical protein